MSWRCNDYRSSEDGQIVLQPVVEGSQWLEVKLIQPACDDLTLRIKQDGLLDAQKDIERIMEACTKFFKGGLPSVSDTIVVQQLRPIVTITSSIDPKLIEVLPLLRSLSDSTKKLPVVARQNLYPVLQSGDKTFAPQTRPVTWNDKVYLSKGPLDASRAKMDLQEVGNILGLPAAHPNIVPPPAALICASETDAASDRAQICGFLINYYRNESLDHYARSQSSNEYHLSRWATQLVSAVHFLIDSGTWHGDIKPDNILVSDEGDLVLADLTRDITTMAIAAPEVIEESYASGNLGTPTNWSLDEIEKSEVYSIGRTLFFICEGIPMKDVYLRKGPENGQFPTRFQSSSATSPHWQGIITACTQQSPALRPTLDRLQEMINGTVN